MVDDKFVLSLRFSQCLCRPSIPVRVVCIGISGDNEFSVGNRHTADICREIRNIGIWSCMQMWSESWRYSRYAWSSVVGPLGVWGSLLHRLQHILCESIGPLCKYCNLVIRMKYEEKNIHPKWIEYGISNYEGLFAFFSWALAMDVVVVGCRENGSVRTPTELFASYLFFFYFRASNIIQEPLSDFNLGIFHSILLSKFRNPFKYSWHIDPLSKASGSVIFNENTAIGNQTMWRCASICR